MMPPLYRRKISDDQIDHSVTRRFDEEVAASHHFDATAPVCLVRPRKHVLPHVRDFIVHTGEDKQRAIERAATLTSVAAAQMKIGTDRWQQQLQEFKILKHVPRCPTKPIEFRQHVIIRCTQPFELPHPPSRRDARGHAEPDRRSAMTLADRMRKLDTDQRPHALTEYCK